MLEKTKLNNVQRATETLRGIVAGLVADYELNNSEIGRLVDWLSIHSDLLDRSPFRDLNALLNRVLEDQVIDEDERQEIMEWCREFSDPSSHPSAKASDANAATEDLPNFVIARGEATVAISITRKSLSRARTFSLISHLKLLQCLYTPY